MPCLRGEINRAPTVWMHVGCKDNLPVSYYFD